MFIYCHGFFFFFCIFHWKNKQLFLVCIFSQLGCEQTDHMRGGCSGWSLTVAADFVVCFPRMLVFAAAAVVLSSAWGLRRAGGLLLSFTAAADSEESHDLLTADAVLCSSDSLKFLKGGDWELREPHAALSHRCGASKVCLEVFTFLTRVTRSWTKSLLRLWRVCSSLLCVEEKKKTKTVHKNTPNQ